MNLIEKLKLDSRNNREPVLKMVSQRILDLLEKWENNSYGSDFFIFAHTFKVNGRLYRRGAKLDSEQFDKLEEIMEMLDNPKQ